MSFAEIAPLDHVPGSGAFLAELGRMATAGRDWIDAASCSEGPPLSATFRDLPRTQQREMLRLAGAALLSTAFFVGIGMLPRPVPSRSLSAYLLLPNATAVRDGVLHARVEPRPLRQRTRTQLTSVRETSDVEPIAGSDAPAPDRRRNRLSRFFRSVFRGVQPSALRTDLP